MVIALASFVLVACTNGSSSPPTQNPSQLLASSTTSARAASSLHYLATTAWSGGTVTITGDVSSIGGSQTIVAAVNGQTGHVTVTLVNKTAYFRGDEIGLAGFMGLPAAVSTQFANRWISVDSTNAAFASVAAGLTTSSALSEIAVAKPLTFRGTAQKMNERVFTIGGIVSGNPPGATKPVKVPVSLYVQTAKAHLPVYYTGTLTQNGKRQTQSVALSGWNEPVTASAPVGSVPIGTLGSTPVEA